ncbi:MAG: UDP-N-acetylmuramoyl-L-alanyl-D-glutamate--2,6-diaminopimelate ligase [Lentisphaeria bacterium]|nr:UDP-N-acetylmuramoyl-L-alanyl-D-glutamate--2,6-diaminopimelate ligase [Lentisphaeria bacterium]
MSFKLSDFLAELPAELIKGKMNYADCILSDIGSNSQKVVRDSIFIAVNGANVDGADFICEAIQKGAKVILTERNLDGWGAKYPEIVFIQIENSRLINSLSCEFLCGKNFLEQLTLLGVTGTNGKTTTVYLLYQIFEQLNKKSGLISTIKYFDGKTSSASTHTTPPAEKLFLLLSACSSNLCEYVPMEISSHSLAQCRLGSLKFRIGMFTNLSGEHLDFHHDMENYYQIKKSFFVKHVEIAVVNIDNEYGARLAEELKNETAIKVVTFGTSKSADYQIKIIPSSKKTEFTLNDIEFCSNLLGEYNIYNLTTVIVSLMQLGFAPEVLKNVIKNSELTIPGRLELITLKKDVRVFIDYAHTDDALKNVLSNLKKLPHKKIIVVFGCGGNRDKFKRPRMGEIASTLADWVIITTDNPRFEEPMAIIDDIKSAIQDRLNYEIIENRADAIKKALAISENGDIVIIAGKGHENYQEINGERCYFSDSEEVRKFEMGK